MLASPLVALPSLEGWEDMSPEEEPGPREGMAGLVPLPSAKERQRLWGPGVLTDAPCSRQVSPILGMITGTLILVLVPATKRGPCRPARGSSRHDVIMARDMKALIRK